MAANPEPSTPASGLDPGGVQDLVAPLRHEEREAILGRLDAWIEERERLIDEIDRRIEERFAKSSRSGIQPETEPVACT
jgi:hypothetical protein